MRKAVPAKQEAPAVDPGESVPDMDTGEGVEGCALCDDFCCFDDYDEQPEG